MSLLDLKEEETSCDEWLLAEDYLRNDVNDADQKINSALKPYGTCRLRHVLQFQGQSN